MESSLVGFDRYFYSVISEVEDANVICSYTNHETVMLPNFISFHFNESKMVRMAEQPGPYYLEVTSCQLERFRSWKPWVSTMILPGFNFAIEAFVETFTVVLNAYTVAGPNLVTIPVPFYGTYVIAYLLSSSATAGCSGLRTTPNLVFNSDQDSIPDHDKRMLMAKPLTINPLFVSTST